MEKSRRAFLKSISILAGGTLLPLPSWGFGLGNRKLTIALVGTGIRGINTWGKRLVEQYSDYLEYVGLCDINPGRLKYALSYMQVNCPTFTEFGTMIKETKPDLVIVTTTDATHHHFIIQGLEMGCDVLSEKPLTTDEIKCQQIIDAEKRADKNSLLVLTTGGAHTIQK